MSNVASFLPYGRHHIDEDDIAAVTEVLRSESLTGGPLVAQFEGALATRHHAHDVVVCSNGTAALHLAALALDLKPGDRVIVPSLTFLATASAAIYVGADVVFSDVDPDTGLMRASDLQAAFARSEGKAKAVFPVHLNGGCVDLDAVADFAGSKDLVIVDDACHALGASFRNEVIGNGRKTTMSIFSMHPVKTIAMGEGGAIATNNANLAEKLRRFRNHGMVREPRQFTQTHEAYDDAGDLNPWYYEMPTPGFNYRASEINCALGLSQLKKLDSFLARRKVIADRYDKALAPLAPLLHPVPRVAGCEGGWHLYPILVDFTSANFSRGDLMRELSKRGIGTQVHYQPVHRQPFWRARQPEINLPGADAYYARCLSLPFFPTMTNEDVDRVVDTLKSILR